MDGVVVRIVEAFPFGRDHLELSAANLDLAREADAHAGLECSRKVGLLPPPDAQAAGAVAYDRLGGGSVAAQVLHADAGNLADDGEFDALQRL